MQISRCNARGEIKSIPDGPDMSRSPREPWSGRRCDPSVVATHDITHIATVLFQNKSANFHILVLVCVIVFLELLMRN